ncbi:MAG: sulfatase-like hydrolase/transferase [Planctomycetes bacterium]|nr:sulfatase-like hydrolase/transferase [Planctomycetota bacterium]
MSEGAAARRGRPFARAARRARLPAAAALLLAAFFASGCGEREHKRSIVLISIDTLRWDHLGCTGHAAAVTPVLDGLARAGTLFPNCVAAAPLTLPSHCTILTGQLPIEHGVRDNGSFRLPEGSATLASELRARGYATYAVIGAQPLAPGCGLEAGFDCYDYAVLRQPAGHVRLDERRADQVTAAALAALRGHEAGRPFFLFVHYFDPHSPYAPPEPFAQRFSPKPYDGEIAFTDQEIGRLLDGLRALGLLEDAVLAVTSDHGESLGEHGEEAHGFFLYDATIRVPLIVQDPASPERGRVEPAQVRHQDLRAFLAARAAGEAYDLTQPGREGEPALIESLYGAIHCNFAQLRGLRNAGGLKYLESGAEELYDLDADPGEAKSLAAEGDARLDAARAALARALAGRRAAARSGSGALPGYLQTPLSPELITTRSAEENRSFPAAPAWRPSIEALQDGIRLHEAGLFDSASARLEEGARQDPHNPALWLWLGLALRQAGAMERAREQHEQAIAALERALVLRPDLGQARDLLIHCLTQTGRYQEAWQAGLAAEEAGTAGAKTFEAIGKLLLTERGQFAAEDNPLHDQARGIHYLEKAVGAGDAPPDPALEEYLERCLQGGSRR